MLTPIGCIWMAATTATSVFPYHFRGTAQPNGSMTLCGARRPLSVANSATVPRHQQHTQCPAKCRFPLMDAMPLACGGTGKTSCHHPEKVGGTDDTDQIRLEGDIEIPMWHHARASSSGHLQSIGRMPGIDDELRLINKRTGETDNQSSDCMAGMIMTTIT